MYTRGRNQSGLGELELWLPQRTQGTDLEKSQRMGCGTLAFQTFSVFVKVWSIALLLKNHLLCLLKTQITILNVDF